MSAPLSDLVAQSHAALAIERAMNELGPIEVARRIRCAPAFIAALTAYAALVSVNDDGEWEKPVGTDSWIDDVAAATELGAAAVAEWEGLS